MLRTLEVKITHKYMYWLGKTKSTIVMREERTDQFINLFSKNFIFYRLKLCTFVLSLFFSYKNDSTHLL